MKPKLLVFALALSAAAQVKITPGAGKIDIEIAGKPYSTFYMTGDDVTKPYLWPVRAVLTESRVMTFYDDPALRVIDFDITLTSVQEVVWGDGKDGAFGIRLRPVLDEQGGTGKIVNAEGLAGERGLWGKPSNWCDYSGAIGDEKIGVTILDHPENPRHPVRWHARGYGLFAANPFGLSVFTGDRSQNGAQTVAPGKSLHFRYRVIVHPGSAQAAGIDALYAKYAAGK
jgi:hypothetical protein